MELHTHCISIWNLLLILIVHLRIIIVFLHKNLPSMNIVLALLLRVF